MFELSLGGLRVRVTAPDGLTVAPNTYGPFLAHRDPRADIAIDLDVRVGAPPRSFSKARASSELRMRTDTWAVSLTGDAEWPFHFGPPPSNPSEPPVPHVLASADFMRLRAYLPSADPLSWVLFPLDEVLLFHLLHFVGGTHVHASAIDVGGRMFLFLGDSEAGKSTIAGLFERVLGPNRVYSDDRIVIRRHAGRWCAFGSPWHGTLPRIKAGGLPIGGFFFIEKTPRHELERLGSLDAFARLFKVAFGPTWLPGSAPRHISILESVVSQREFSLYRLGFTPDESVVDFVLQHERALGAGAIQAPVENL